MTKKIITIVCMAVVIALFTGAITFFSSGCGKDDDSDPTLTVVPTEDVTAPDDPATEAPDETEAIIPTEAETDAPTEAVDPDSHGYTAILSSAETYRIRRVYDHTVGGEVTAREVFGKLYSYCSLTFADDGTFELCINPNSGETRRGTYMVYDDVISAEYDDGVGTEFRIITDGSGEIDSILVNYGDYDVYFGL